MSLDGKTLLPHGGQSSNRPAYIITGPTSGIGLATALELAKHGNVVLVGRDRGKLDNVRKTIEQVGAQAFSVVCDLSDPANVRRAATEIIALDVPLVGLLNNAGIRQSRATTNPLGWDVSFATNHVGPFLLTEALMPHLPDGAMVGFVVSAVEDPDRKPAVKAGFRGGRYVSAEASARGEWTPGGSKQPGYDAYATSKQAILAAALAFARETPRLHFSAIEPGVNPATALTRDGGAAARFLSTYIVPLVVPLLMPFVKVLSTPKRAAQVITKVMTDPFSQSGIYYDERGLPMLGSERVRDPAFQDRVVAETRALLSAVATTTNRNETDHVAGG